MRLAVLLALASLSACTAPDAHVPPFAKLPYQAFSREAVVAIALREWRLFGAIVDDDVPGSARPTVANDKPERRPGLWQRIGEYWWLGMDAGAPESAWTGMHDGDGAVFAPDDDERFAWSAVFISYVMRIAGAGRRFPYAANHASYINAAERMATGRDRDWIITAERPAAYAPVAGDLVCTGRDPSQRLDLADLPADWFPAHCDIVVGQAAGAAIPVVGGNVHDGVAMRYLPVTAGGLLAGLDGTLADPRNRWLVVLRLIVGNATASVAPGMSVRALRDMRVGANNVAGGTSGRGV